MNQTSLFARQHDEAASLHQSLLAELKALSFRAFAQCLQELFEAMGYTRVQVVAGRSRHGRTRAGGMDMRLQSQTGVTGAHIIVQVKQYVRPVSRRFVDELRGAMARTGARHGLLVTSSAFARAAARAAAQDHTAPVKLIGGDELADLMLQHGRGVRSNEFGERVADAAYFAALRDEFPLDKRRTWRRRVRLEEYGAQATGLADEQQHNQGASNQAPIHTQGGEMRWHTHALAGMNSVWLLEAIGALAPQTIPLAVSFAAFGALLPDLDAVESKIKSVRILNVQPFAPLAAAANRTWGHRGVLHSPAVLLVVAAAVVPIGLLVGWVPATALWLGYASHIALDACTPVGVPSTKERGRLYLLPKRWRIPTGSAVEDLLFPALAMAVVLMLLRHIPFG